MNMEADTAETGAGETRTHKAALVDPEGVSHDTTFAGGYSHSYSCSETAARNSYSCNTYAGFTADGAAEAAADTPITYAVADGGQDHTAADGHGGDTAAADTAAAAASAYSWPSDPEAMLSLLQQQRQQYRSWVAQCASTALAALDSTYTTTYYGSSAATDTAAGGQSTVGIPDDVPGLMAAMDVAGTVRQYLLLLKAAAESVRAASVAGANFDAMSLPEAESYDDTASAAAGEAAEAAFVSAAYGVTTEVAAARALLDQLADLAGSPAAALTQEVLYDEPPDAAAAGGSGGCSQRAPVVAERRLEAPLVQKLERVGAGLCRRLRQDAEILMSRIHWPPPLADGSSSSGGGGGSSCEGGSGGGGAAVAGLEAGFRGFELHPVLARRLVGVLTALTHYQMAVEHRSAFYDLLLAGSQASPEAELQQLADGPTGAGERGAKPLLWAAQALAEPVAAKLRAHFHPAAPTGRLDRPAWLYGTALEFIRQHGHSLASLDDMLACLQLKPHYNMPAEFARALQDAVLQLLRDLRIPAILELRNHKVVGADGADNTTEADGAGAASAADAAEAEADALLMGLMDASAAYDVAMLPLLGATGPRAEADAAKALAMLSAAAAAGGAVLQRRRACDQLDPTAVGTADMHLRYVAVAADGPPGSTAPPAAPALLQAWAAAEGAAALRAVEALAYDDSSLAPAEEAAAQALGGGGGPLPFDELGPGGVGSSGGGVNVAWGGGGGGGGAAPWQRDTWPPVLAREAAAVLDGLVARSRWLSADPVRQREFLEAAAGPMLALLRRRLGRLVDQAASRGEAVSEEGLPRVCAALCAAHFLEDHLQSLLLTDLAPLVQALNAAAAAAAAVAAGDDAAADASNPATPSSSFTAAGGGAPPGKLGGGGFWSGLISAAAGGIGGGVPASPARQALHDGVTALAGGVAGAVIATCARGSLAAPVLDEFVRSYGRLHRDGCLKLAREVALGFGRCSVAYRHAIEANPQFPFTPESDAEADGEDDRLADGGVGSGSAGFYGLSRPASSITPSFGPALLFLQASLDRLSRCCDKATFADVWRGAALSINRFMFNFIATESRFTRAGARQFAADVAGLAHLFTPYSRRRAVGTAAASTAASRMGSFSGGGPAAAAAAAFSSPAGGGGGGGGQHFRELQAAARLLSLGDEEAADVMRRASAAAVAAQAAVAAHTAAPAAHTRGDPVRSGMSADPVLSSAGLACLSPLQIMNVVEHRI